MSDQIYRQATIDALMEILDRPKHAEFLYTDEICKTLNELPSAQPERTKGRWIKHPEWQADGECAYECDQCGMGSDVNYDFCMRCGADMRQGEKDEQR